MSFLVRIIFTVAGEVEHDETVVATVDELVALEKGVSILGTPGKLRIEFDPPLTPREVPA